MSLKTLVTTQRKQRWLPWCMWGLGALFCFYEFLLQVSLGVLGKDLMQAFSLDATGLGILAACYFYTYAMQLPAGVLLDNYGPRRLLFISTMLCALGCFLFASAETIRFAQLGRLLMGAGSAFAAMSTLKLAANWFSTRHFALLTGLTFAVGMLGAAAGEAPLAYFVQAYHWRTTLYGLGIIGLILAFALFLFVRDTPSFAVDETAEEVPQLPWLTALKEVVCKPCNWVASGYGALMYFPTLALGGLWGVPFLMSLYSISRTHAGELVSFLFFGWAVGAPLFGWISDHMGRRKPALYVGSFIFLTLTVTVTEVSVTMVAMTVLLFLLGIFCSCFLVSYAVIKETNHPHSSATALSFINSINLLSGIFGHPLIGFFLDQQQDKVIIDSLAIYSVAGYREALIILPILVAVAIILLPFIPETDCRSQYESETPT